MSKVYEVNIDKGINYCGGMEDLYYEILGDYVEKTRMYKDEISKYYAENNIKEYIRVSHTLKSTSLTVGMDEFSELAKKHEFAAKEENTEFIRDNFVEYIQCIDAAVAAVENVMKNR